MENLQRPKHPPGIGPYAALIGNQRHQLLRWRDALKRYLLISAGVGLSSLAIAVAVAVTIFAGATPSLQLRSSTQAAGGALNTHWPSAIEQPRRPLLNPAELGAFALLTPQQRPGPPAAPILPAADQFVVGQWINNVNITFYDCLSQGFCGHMYGGKIVYEGAAACSWNLAIGTHFTIVGDPTERVYVCEDRGLLPNTWVDIFWHDPSDGWLWQASVGRSATIEILITP